MPVSLGETTTPRATCGSMIRAISHALPVTSNTTGPPRPGSARTAPTPPAASRSATQTAHSGSAIAISHKSRCTSNPIALTLVLVIDLDETREPWATTPTHARSKTHQTRTGPSACSFIPRKEALPRLGDREPRLGQSSVTRAPLRWRTSVEGQVGCGRSKRPAARSSSRISTLSESQSIAGMWRSTHQSSPVVSS